MEVKKTEKHKYAAYFNKATEFYYEMKHAETEGKWNAACLNAIHCAISCGDAVSTFFLGRRSSGQRHEDAALLIRETKLPGSEEKAKQFLDVIRLKNLVEYEADEAGENETRKLTKQTERIYAWAKQQLHA